MNFNIARLAVALGVAGFAALAYSVHAQASTMLVFSMNGAPMEMTRDEFDSIEQIVVETENDFSDGMAKFGGPRARDVFAAAGAPLEGVGVFVAANDYKVEIPLQDFISYDVIFATSMNGERLSLRDKGPIWIIYPMSDHPELKDSAYNSRLIWQLVKIELK